MYGYGAYNQNNEGLGYLRKGTLHIQEISDGFIQASDPSKAWQGDSGAAFLIPFNGGAIDRPLSEYVIGGVQSWVRFGTFQQDTTFATLNTDIANWFNPIVNNTCAHGDTTCYSENFESASLTGWTLWQNCAADASGAIGPYDTSLDNPAPSGRSYALRMHTGPFTPGCAGGAFAASPPRPAVGGKTYRVDAYTRNASNPGSTFIIFQNAAGQDLSQQAVSWNSDAWQYNADPTGVFVAPIGTTRFIIRFGLSAPNAYADVDRLRVDWN